MTDDDNIETRDIMAIQPSDIAGNVKKAAHMSALLTEALKHLPKWIGRHPRVDGNNPSAEVTPYGTLLFVNEITMEDLPGFIQWLTETSGLKLSAILPCGHPASALIDAPRRQDSGPVPGGYAEDSTNVGQVCGQCAAEKKSADATERKLKKAQAALDAHDILRDELRSTDSKLKNLREDNANQAKEINRLKLKLEKQKDAAAELKKLQKEVEKQKKRYVHPAAVKPRGKAKAKA